MFPVAAPLPSRVLGISVGRLPLTYCCLDSKPHSGERAEIDDLTIQSPVIAVGCDLERE